MYIDPPLVSSHGTGLDAQPWPGQRQGQARPFPQPFPCSSWLWPSPSALQTRPRGRSKTGCFWEHYTPPASFTPPSRSPGWCMRSPQGSQAEAGAPWGSPAVLWASCSGLRAPRGPTSDAPLWCPFLVGFQCCGGTDTCVWLAFSRWPSSLEDAARRAPSEARVPQGDMERWLMAFRRGTGVTAGAVCQKLPTPTQVKGPGRAGQGQTAGAATPC